MTKELSDLAWACLPKEFKEEVKRLAQYYSRHISALFGMERQRADKFYYEFVSLFGRHNLTSDAEEDDEMLTVSRKQIDALQGEIFKAIMDAHDADDWQDAAHYILDVMPRSFAALFGSKCLPDEGTDCTPVEVGVAENATTNNVDSSHGNVESLEPKPVEPKFKEGNIVRYRYDGKLYIVVCKTGKYHYALRQYDCDIMIHDALESDLEPYTEPTANYLRSEGALNTAVLAGNYSSASTCDKQFDNIIKDGFKNHNRLHIAAMAMAGLLANTNNNADISEIVADALQ